MTRNLVYYEHVWDALARLPDNCVQCVITSPPYWGLRKYAGNQDVVWGGKAVCEHKWGDEIKSKSESGWNTFAEYRTNGGAGKRAVGIKNIYQGQFCQICGAWRGALGLEPTIEMYVAHIVEIFREVRRVLRKDGVCFLNMGDSYTSGLHGAYPTKSGDKLKMIKDIDWSQKKDLKGLKAKDLCMIPARVALALQADGWYLRSDIIWSKPNPMPESVTDRPTKSYDHIFLLTKSAKYYWDNEAVKEKYTEPLNRWGGSGVRASNNHKYIEMAGHNGKQHYGATSMFRKGRPVRPQESGRNCRDCWVFPTVGYKGAHFAAFPPELPRRCILAGSSHKACPKCGSPWKRIIKPTNNYKKHLGGKGFSDKNWVETSGGHRKSENYPSLTSSYQTLGWQPTCKCGKVNDGSGKCIILDPFAGSGTTLAVAAKLDRDYIGIEIAEEYRPMIEERIKTVEFNLTSYEQQAGQMALWKGGL